MTSMQCNASMPFADVNFSASMSAIHDALPVGSDVNFFSSMSAGHDALRQG